jgi:hypothetical protein
MRGFKIPDALKDTAPPTVWGKILITSPVVMAVIATMLAGLSSGEMGRAQYDRSLAAQQQSKAGDQWSFFQAKRLRSVTQRNTVDLMQAMIEIGPLSMDALKKSAAQFPAEMDLAGNQIQEMRQRMPGGDADAAIAAARTAAEKYLQNVAQRKAEAAAIKSEMLAALDSPEVATAIVSMQCGALPDIGADPVLDPDLKTALDVLESSKPESEIAPFVAAVGDKVLYDALRVAKDRAQALDVVTRPTSQAIDRIEKLLARQTALLQEARAVLAMGGVAPRLAPTLNREFAAARLAFAAVRYDGEARRNQAVANLYELQVRKSNLSAERHHMRSQRFFYGMLGAQLAVIISTFAIAARQRNLLWSLAAAAGLLALAFGGYVYLYV